MHSICSCARFQYDLQQSHLKAIKRILQYLVGTTNKCLFYKKKQDFSLVGYYDAEDRVERKNASRGCHYIGPSLISWASKKKNFIALSTTEVATSCCSQLL